MIRQQIRTRSFTVTGRGVGIYEIDATYSPPKTARNVLEAAARCDDLADAIMYVGNSLGMDDFRLAFQNLSEAARWRRLPIDARLREIAGWLTAECYELMDFVESPRVDTLGD